jgi:hypothetical protein
MSRKKLKPKRLADFPKAYRDAMAHWSAFRQLGFDANDIYFGFGVVDREPDVVHLQLKTQGLKFTVIVAQLPGHSFEHVTKTWKQFATLAQSSEQAERERCYREHVIGQSIDYFLMFVQSIREKGILVPEVAHLEPHAVQA